MKERPYCLDYVHLTWNLHMQKSTSIYMKTSFILYTFIFTDQMFVNFVMCFREMYSDIRYAEIKLLLPRNKARGTRNLWLSSEQGGLRSWYNKIYADNIFGGICEFTSLLRCKFCHQTQLILPSGGWSGCWSQKLKTWAVHQLWLRMMVLLVMSMRHFDI